MSEEKPDQSLIYQAISERLAKATTLGEIGMVRKDLDDFIEEERLRWVSTAKLTNDDIKTVLVLGDERDPRILDALFKNRTWDAAAREAVEAKALGKIVSKYGTDMNTITGAARILRASAAAGVMRQVTVQTLWQFVRKNGDLEFDQLVRVCGVLAQLPEGQVGYGAGAAFNEILALVRADKKWALAKYLGRAWGANIAVEFSEVYFTYGTLGLSTGPADMDRVPNELCSSIIRSCHERRWQGVPRSHMTHFLNSVNRSIYGEEARMVCMGCLQEGILDDIGVEQAGVIADILLNKADIVAVSHLLARANGNLHNAILGKIRQSGPETTRDKAAKTGVR